MTSLQKRCASPLSQSALHWDGHRGQLEGGLQGPASGGERGRVS